MRIRDEKTIGSGSWIWYEKIVGSGSGIRDKTSRIRNTGSKFVLIVDFDVFYRRERAGASLVVRAHSLHR
jgi:hypothetical protein